MLTTNPRHFMQTLSNTVSTQICHRHFVHRLNLSHSLSLARWLMMMMAVCVCLCFCEPAAISRPTTRGRHCCHCRRCCCRRRRRRRVCASSRVHSPFSAKPHRVAPHGHRTVCVRMLQHDRPYDRPPARPPALHTPGTPPEKRSSTTCFQPPTRSLSASLRWPGRCWSSITLGHYDISISIRTHTHTHTPEHIQCSTHALNHVGAIPHVRLGWATSTRCAISLYMPF